MTKPETHTAKAGPGAGDRAAIVNAVDLAARAETLGRVEELADGLMMVSGLESARLGEILELEDGGFGFVLNLERDIIHAVLLDQESELKTGAIVRRTNHLLSVPVGEALLGRVVDPLGRPIDGGNPIETDQSSLIERPAPAIIERAAVTQPVQTGLLSIDALFAIGRGQRELIIGERATGKTAIAVDTIINQKDSDIICIYVAIGQRASAIQQVIASVRDKGNFARCIFVAAPATAEPGLQWMAPFAGMAMAEYFRDKGMHALIVLDDLTKHARTHRELALLARQPVGREAYPGDIFYLHARLLERAAKLSPAKGGGSLTALPIAEIQAGNLAAFIPTNLISITDGQIVLSSKLFAANQRPAVDVGLSVSRVGGKAQVPALKSVAGQVRLGYAQYQELKMFSRFGGFSDANLKARIAHGERIGALLGQQRFSPLAPTDQIALLAALDDGILDDAPIGRVIAAKSLVHAVISAEPKLADFIKAPLQLDGATRALLIACVRQALADATSTAATVTTATTAATTATEVDQ